MGFKSLSTVLVLISIQSCTLFSPRDSEDPTTGGDFWVEPFSPGIAVEDFVNSFNKKSSLNYMRILNDSFTFIPYEPDTFGSGGLFVHWDRSLEQEYIENLFSSNDSIFISVAESLKDSTETLAVFYYTYDVFHIEQSEGLLLFYIVPDFSSMWYISKIEDLGGGNRSWTYLRKEYFSGGF